MKSFCYFYIFTLWVFLAEFANAATNSPFTPLISLKDNSAIKGIIWKVSVVLTNQGANLEAVWVAFTNRGDVCGAIPALTELVIQHDVRLADAENLLLARYCAMQTNYTLAKNRYLLLTNCANREIKGRAFRGLGTIAIRKTDDSSAINLLQDGASAGDPASAKAVAALYLKKDQAKAAGPYVFQALDCIDLEDKMDNELAQLVGLAVLYLDSPGITDSRVYKKTATMLSRAGTNGVGDDVLQAWQECDQRYRNGVAPVLAQTR